MALFFYWKADRLLMVVGFLSPLSKSSFIYFILVMILVFLHPKSPIGRNRESGSLSVHFLYTSGLKRQT